MIRNPLGLTQWHWDNDTIAIVLEYQPWDILVNSAIQSETKQSTNTCRVFFYSMDK